MRARKHIHKYELIPIGRNSNIFTYKCADTGCTHYMPNHILGRTLQSRCWNCEVPFVIDTKKNERMHPVCDDCENITMPEVGPNAELRNFGEDIEDRKKVLDLNKVRATYIEVDKAEGNRDKAHEDAIDRLMKNLPNLDKLKG